MAQSSHSPFYRQMTALLRNALDLLDEQGREEVLRFILGQQNPDGGFRDRAGRSDLYYSLFGGLMLKAVEKAARESGTRNPKIERRDDVDLTHPSQDPKPETRNPKPVTESILNLKQFIARQSSSEVPGFIEKCCLALLQKDLNIGRISRIRTLISLGQALRKEHQFINISYRSFVLFLTLDAVFPFPRILKSAAKRMLMRTTVDEHSPCPEVAASLFLQKLMNRDGAAEQELLKSYVCGSGGFKAFVHLKNADMLSTAVALFALNFSGADLRLLRPACLGFIQQNYSDGAFLSGDGDQTADVEYTFYGLLAAGVLAD